MQQRILRLHRRWGPAAIVIIVTLAAEVLAVGLSWAVALWQHRTGAELIADLVVAVVVPLFIAPLVGTAVARLLGSMAAAYDHMGILASTDPLTSLPNRRRFFAEADRLLGRVAPSTGLLVVMIDVDRFKEINDTRGHAAGDRALLAVAHRIASAVPAAGLVGRLGGDEFACLIPVRAGAVEGPLAAIRGACTDIWVEPGVTLNASVGHSVMDRAHDIDAALAAADDDLLREKARRGAPRRTQRVPA